MLRSLGAIRASVSPLPESQNPPSSHHRRDLPCSYCTTFREHLRSCSREQDMQFSGRTNGVAAHISH